MTPKLLRIKEVQKIIGFSQAMIYRLMASGDFPEPIHLAARTTAWLESGIKDFIMDVNFSDSGKSCKETPFS